MVMTNVVTIPGRMHEWKDSFGYFLLAEFFAAYGMLARAAFVSQDVNSMLAACDAPIDDVQL